MKAILDWFHTQFGSLYTSFTGWLLNTSAGKLARSVATAGAFLWSLFGPLWDILNFDQMIQQVADAIAAAAAQVHRLPNTSIVAQLNTIFPLAEFLFFTSFIMGLYLTVMGIRAALWIFSLAAKISGLLVRLVTGN